MPENELLELYADAAASYPPIQPVAVMGMARGVFIRNPNSIHDKGRQARKRLENARARIADCIHAKPWQIGFTPSATAACRAYLNGEHRVYASPHEHKAVLSCPGISHVQNLERQALMLANNETGEIYEDEIKKMAERGKIVFTDATAAMGHIPVDVQSLGVAGLAAGAHKFGGLCGIGFLYKRGGFMMSESGNIIDPFPGTVPVMLADIMANALQYRTGHMYESECLSASRQRLEEEILTEIPGSHINAYGKKKLPGIISVRFDGVPASRLITALDALGLYVSAGAACSGSSTEPSPTLLADGLSEEQALSTIRISMYEAPPPGFTDFILNALKCAVPRFREG